MGKTKTKYPVKIKVQFYHMIINEAYQYEVFDLELDRSPLKYADIEKAYELFVKNTNIIKPTLIQFYNDGNQEIVNDSFQIDVPLILDQFQATLTFLVSSQIYIWINDITSDINSICSEIELIKNRLNEIPTKEELNYSWKTPAPELTQNLSTRPITACQKALDLGILFSEPIFDEMKKKPALNPVDFRSEIQRLHTALKSSMKADINLKCEIATKQNLKHLIKYSTPKILHIICHGNSEGALQFEDDSKTVLGALQLVKTDEIIETLRNFVDLLPQVVFINSCFSERVGQAFFKMGVNYVISIDSQDTIEDQAAQIFSQHFYRNIFSGQKVKEAFLQAKERVKLKHNSFGCCCRHSSKEKHKKNCRWLEMIRRGPNNYLIDDQEKIQKHKLFHIPSDLCKCQLKHLNRHKQSCQWARQSLFHINNDFRIQDGDTFRFPKFKNQFPSYLPKDQLVICCCFNYQSPNEEPIEYRLPHSESNKFKIFQNTQKIKKEFVFDISCSTGRQLYKQINDLTPPQLVETHQKIESSIMGRQRQIYEFMKRIKDLNQIIYLVYGPVGVGRTSFVLKCVTYLIQRRVFQLYFYIDLYGIKDKDIFRYKFNEVTKFYYDGEVKLQKVKNKMMIIIFDNADDFFELQRDQLYEELKNLRQQLHKSKVILTLKQQNCNTFDFEKVHSEKYGLEPLGIQAATQLIFFKMRHLFDITVQYTEIDGLVRSNEALRIPKFIESLCHSFSTVKKKIKVNQIKKKLELILQGDGAGNKLIEQNIKILKQKSDASYNLLLFMSQFSQGLSLDDFKMLAIYENKESLIHLPIGKNWQTVLATFFQKKEGDEFQKDSLDTESNFTEQSEFSNPSLKNIQSQLNYRQGYVEKEKERKKAIRGESYFIDQVSENRYIVKRFIRDFIWKKHESPENYYMKYLFIGHMSVMLEFYFKWLTDSKYIHEDLLECSSISEAGVFGIKDNMFNPPPNLTESVRMFKEHKSEFQKIITEHKSLVQKIRKSDPSIFIANHKQDFLNIYEKRWEIIFKYLKELKEKNKDKKMCEDKACMNYLQNLIIFIPTAFKIAKVESSLLKYIISKSMSMLNRLQKYSEDQNYVQNHKILAIQLKLNLMKVSIDIEKIDIDLLKNELEGNKEFTSKLMKGIKDDEILQYAKKYWVYEKSYILMYKEYINRKQMPTKSFIDKNKASYEKVKGMIEILLEWLSQNWDQAEQILFAKRNLILGLFYLNILKFNSGNPNTHTNTLKLKKQHERNVLQLLNLSAKIFNGKGLMKLCLRAKLTIIQICECEVISPKKKISKSQQLSTQSTQLFEDLIDTQKKVLECEAIYTDRRNNLIGFMEFENQIKNLKNLLKQKFWTESSDTLVCMRPVPLIIDGDTPIIENLVRKKNRFRKEIQKIVDSQIDLCTKFEILTKAKLKEQVQNGCMMLLLTSNVKIHDRKPYLVFEGIRMEQDLVQINQNFTQQYDLSKIKILMIAGNNAFQAIKELEKILADPPIMISLGSQTLCKGIEESKKQKIQYKKPQDLQIFTIEEKRKTQINFFKHFIKMLMERDIHNKEEIFEICKKCQNIAKGCLELRVLYQKRKSPIEIKHKKGTYKDLSPGYQKNHNVDMKTKTVDNSTNFICIRRWKDTYRVFEYIRKRAEAYKSESNQKQSSPAVYINVFGEMESGKSYFIQEIARLLVERQRYTEGVYIIDGKILQKKYQGQFESYFTKQSEAGKIMTLEQFEKNGNEKLMLIIDDFHMIKPRSNGRFNLFIQKIVDKKVNLIIVTNTKYQQENQNKKDSQYMFRKIKPMKIDKLCLFQVDLVASNLLNLQDPFVLEKYEELKAKNFNQIRVQQIYQLKASLYGKKKQAQFSGIDSKEMKKLQSLRQD